MKYSINTKRLFFTLIPLIFLGIGIFVLSLVSFNKEEEKSIVNLPERKEVLSNILPDNQTELAEIPGQKILLNDYHIFQTFNNCGPAALSMALSYYGINVSQQELGIALRPYQNPQGDNDDKSVTLEQLGDKAKDYGFIPYHRAMGDEKAVKQFIANDMPVVVRTLLHSNDDIGHFRVIKGYDEEKGIFIQDDSLQGKNLEYSYSEFNEIWKRFNYEYLVLVTPEKQQIAEKILGENLDERRAWENAIDNSRKELSANPNDVYARFNLSVALANIGDYQSSVEEFEKVENSLSFRTLWYQIEPIEAYFETGNYAKVFELTDKILNNGNRAFSELYILRGKIYQERGQIELARAEFEKAVFYNNNLAEAKTALSSV